MGDVLVEALMHGNRSGRYRVHWVEGEVECDD